MAFRDAHRWVCVYDDEVLIRLRNGQAPLRANKVPRDPDVFIGWHNLESHAIAAIDRIDVFPTVPTDWVAMFMAESLVGAPNPWTSV